jgi:hypothetical protein
MATGADRIEAINDVRLHMWAVSRRDLSPAEHAANKPLPATWDDAEERALTLQSEAASLRARVAGGKWRAAVVESWTASAEDLERRWREHDASTEHKRWLRSGGPARLWDVLAARKKQHEEVAALVEGRWPDVAASKREAAADAQRLMDTMIKLYLQQEAV